MLSSIIVGGGPGGLGPLLWAAQHGVLPAWLDHGVAVVDRQAHLGGTLGRFGIHSDSLGNSYLECLEAPGLPEVLLPLRDDPLAREMARYRECFPRSTWSTASCAESASPWHRCWRRAPPLPFIFAPRRARCG